MGLRITLPNRGMSRLRDGLVRTSFKLTTRSVDVPIALSILDEEALIGYLLARLLTLFVPLSLAILGSRVSPHLIELDRRKSRDLFQAAAARINLGYLMVCGSMSLFTLMAAPYVAAVLGVSSTDFITPAIWFLIGSSAPLLFGATRLLMYALDRGAFYELLSGITSIFFVANLVVMPELNAISIAQTFAAAQLTHAGICALLLTQCGIWPGLTALFHKEIKLF